MEHVHITIISLLLKDGKPIDPKTPLKGTACKTGDFLFTNGLFFAKFGTQTHQRMNAADLYDLLISATPLSVATDSGMDRHPLAPQPGPGEHGDYGAGFYCAQLLHYGMQPQQDMDLAKEALLAAFGGRDGKRLEVPKSILEYEEALRKHDEDCRNSWSYSDDGSEQSGSVNPDGCLDPQSQNTEDDARDSPGVSSPSEALTKQTTLKRARAPSLDEESPERRRPGPPGFKTLEEALKAQASKDTIGPKEWVKMYRKQEADRMTSAKEIRASIKSLQKNEARQILTKVLDDLPATERILSKELASNKKSGYSAQTIKPSQWEGLYNIEAPSLETSNNTLEVYSSSTSSHLWATFDFGDFSGFMRSLYPVPTSYDTEVYFEWRGRESGENVICFHQDNRAVITFLPGGLLEGKMSAPRHGTFKIYGSIQVTGANGSAIPRENKAKKRKAVRLWKSEWRGLNEHNYNQECNSRWGPSGGYSRDEEAFESDTTDGNEKRSWEIDLQRFMRSPESDEEDEDEEDEGNSRDGDSEEGDSDGENSEDEDSEEDDSEDEEGEEDDREEENDVDEC